MPLHVGGQRIARVYKGEAKIQHVYRGETQVFYSYRDEAQALFNAMSVKPNEARRRLIEQTIDDLIDAGVWAKADLIHILAAHDAQAARINWKNPSLVLSVVGTPSFTADQGYTGDSDPSHLDAGVALNALSNYSLNSASMGVWVRSNITETLRVIGVSVNVGADITPRSAAGNIILRSNSATLHSQTEATASGFVLVNRTGSGGFTVYKNGSSIATPSIASDAIPTGNLTICRGGNQNSTNQLSATFIGAGLTSGEASDLHSIYSGYLSAVGAI